MDDVEEKARRNLLTYSAAILAIAFLEIPLDGNLIGVVNLDKVDSSKAWIAAAAVLIYLFLRYHYSSTVKQSRFSWGKYRRKYLRVFISGLVQMAGWSSLNPTRRKNPFVRILSNGNPDSLLSPAGHPWDIDISTTKHVWVNGEFVQDVPWSGNYDLLLATLEEGSPLTFSDPIIYSGTYRMTILGQVLVWLLLLRFGMYHVLETILVYLVAAAALLISIYRI